VAEPPGVTPELATDQETIQEAQGVGTEGEVVAWEGRYSVKNFTGRFVGCVSLTLGWCVLAAYTWPGGHLNLRWITIAAGVVLVALWLVLIWRILMARLGHFYRLTNRRLFVSTGVFNRRRDQMELLRVQDVYTKQSFLQRLLWVGTVVVVSSEPHLPVLYLTGVDDPKAVMDLVWHHARSERDRRSVKVDQL
jgi:membrane protein YdbS with pleckstrin-like domain